MWSVDFSISNYLKESLMRKCWTCLLQLTLNKANFASSYLTVICWLHCCFQPLCTNMRFVICKRLVKELWVSPWPKYYFGCLSCQMPSKLMYDLWLWCSFCIWQFLQDILDALFNMISTESADVLRSPLIFKALVSSAPFISYYYYYFDNPSL